jgi:23S rRNA pseudouridine1911/1915/1917 synthase
MTEFKDKKSFIASLEEEGVRLDKLLVSRMGQHTRQYLQKLIESGLVLVNGKRAKASLKVRRGDAVEVQFPQPREMKLKPLKMKLDIVYEDKNVIIINKPAGLVVHPGAGESHIDDSLVNAILYHAKSSLSGIGGVLRPGIVHRLDKDTSGLIIVAKNDKAHQFLSQQFKDHLVEKTYFALVSGRLVPEKGSIQAPIGRDARNRKRMAVVSDSMGRMAITKYHVLKYLGDYTLLEIQLVTGRTHQIRVHFVSIGHPLVGDPLYGRERVNKLFEQEYDLTRVFLHAGRLKVNLPGLKKVSAFEAPLPIELKKVLDELSIL